jgi:Cellulose binding domain/Glycosyl hydrolases family 18
MLRLFRSLRLRLADRSGRHGATARHSASARHDVPGRHVAPGRLASRTLDVAVAEGQQHRRGPHVSRHRRTLTIVPPIALGVALAAGGGGFALTASNSAVAGLTASYQVVSSWGTGYTGQYTLANRGSTAAASWTLSFNLPAGTSVTSLWDGAYSVSGNKVSVSALSWDATIAAGASVEIGFVTASSGTAGQPTGCLVDGAACSAGSGSPAPSRSASGSPTSPPAGGGPTPTPSPTPTSSGTPAPVPTASASPTPGGPTAPPTAGAAGFAPYVDTSLYPPFSLTTTAQQTGVRQFNLAFVVSGGGASGDNGCTPEWGGVTAIGSDPVAAQIGALRAMGGDVRISFGGEDGSELAQTCTSVSQLESAYQQVISAYDVNKIDFDIEGAAIEDAAANQRRDQALAALQAQDSGLQISFTLPVLPAGLTADGVTLLTGAAAAGVQISAVNVMAMDYGDANAPDPATMMGTYAIDAATATDAQVASVLGISDAAAWPKIAVTPMIGQNDQSDEVFTLADAQQLEAFAASKHLAWLSMWSAGRDQECPGGADSNAQPTCSGIVQSPDAFMTALGAY